MKDDIMTQVQTLFEEHTAVIFVFIPLFLCLLEDLEQSQRLNVRDTYQCRRQQLQEPVPPTLIIFRWH